MAVTNKHLNQFIFDLNALLRGCVIPQLPITCTHPAGVAVCGIPADVAGGQRSAG